MGGPTGTGALWARREHLEAMPPFSGGGEMIKEVRFDGTVFNDAPRKFEAGTPNIAGFAGLGAAVDYLDALRSEEHTSELQSLMRISYAVFCLKNKTTSIPTTNPTDIHRLKKPNTTLKPCKYTPLTYGSIRTTSHPKL